MDKNKTVFFFHDVNIHFIASYRCWVWIDLPFGLKLDWSLDFFRIATIDKSLPFPKAFYGLLAGVICQINPNSLRNILSVVAGCDFAMLFHGGKRNENDGPLLSQEEKKASALCLRVYSVQLRENGCK